MRLGWTTHRPDFTAHVICQARNVVGLLHVVVVRVGLDVGNSLCDGMNLGWVL